MVFRVRVPLGDLLIGERAFCFVAAVRGGRLGGLQRSGSRRENLVVAVEAR